MAQFLSWILLALCLTVVTAEAQPTLDSRHQLSGLNSRFDFTGDAFADYVKRTRTVIAAARTDLKGAGSEKIIDGNSPFELTPPKSCSAGGSKPYRRGVVLLHGLTDSPYFMRPLGEFLQGQCFRVMALLLPGHGTRPGDLLDVKWQDWAKAVEFGVASMAKEADHVYLLGFSTGGALSIHHSLKDKRIKGLFLFAPAVRISPKGMMANWHEAYDWLVPSSKWLDVMPDEDPFKYESFSANAADQIHLLTVQLQADLIKVKRFMPPVFVAASEDDASVNTAATIDFFREAIHPLSTMLLYTAKNPEALQKSLPEKIVVLGSGVPSRRILGSAHTALVLPPGNDHYGDVGNYANCLHYYAPKLLVKYRQCKDRKEDYLGEITEENLKKGVVRRMMYNANFDALLARMTSFIATLPSE